MDYLLVVEELCNVFNLFTNDRDIRNYLQIIS